MNPSSARIVQNNNAPALEITTTETKKRVYSEQHLLAKRAYFQSLIDKGQAGLTWVEPLLTQIQNAKLG